MERADLPVIFGKLGHSPAGMVSCSRLMIIWLLDDIKALLKSALHTLLEDMLPIFLIPAVESISLVGLLICRSKQDYTIYR